MLNILLLCSFAVATAEFVLVGLLPEISTDLAVSVPAAGFLVTAYMAVATVGGPAAVVLTRRLPRRSVLAAAMGIAGGSALLSALAPSYGVLLVGRLGSALGQALFVAVASQVAMAVVPGPRQTAAVARVFNGFALATVLGLPLGTLVGQAAGWPVTFGLVAVLCVVGLAGVLRYCPPVPGGEAVGLRAGLPVLLRPRMLAGLGVTVLTFTGFVAAFTYSAPMLRDVTGLGPGWVSAALVLYGLGTVAGTTLAGRVAPDWIGAVLPIPVLGLGAVLLLQGPALHRPLWAVVSLVGLGLSAFALAPLLQTWLMAQAGPAAAALAAAVNISVFGLAGALGAGLGGLLLGHGTGLDRLGPVAAVPVLAAALLAVGVARSRPAPTPQPAGVDREPSGIDPEPFGIDPEPSRLDPRPAGIDPRPERAG